jgi:acetyl-CoA carboxylase carboxyltransferase component
MTSQKLATYLSRLFSMDLGQNGVECLLKSLMDPGSIFLPIAMSRGYDRGGFRVYSGLMNILQRPVLIIVFNQEIQSGVFTPGVVSQILRTLDVAINTQTPVVFWGGSAGADLYRQDQLFVATGGIYAKLAKLRQMGVMTFSVVNGVATAGGAYIPGMCQTVIATGDAQMYLAGPLLVKAAIGQVVSGEALGSAAMHYQQTGLVDHLVADDQEAMNVLKKELLSCSVNPTVSAHSLDKIHIKQVWEEGQFVPETFLEAISTDQVQYYSPHEGCDIVCAYFYLAGVKWACLTSSAPITAVGAGKAADFLAEVTGPVLFIQNTVGFMVGQQQESAGAIVQGSRLLQAIVDLKSVKVTLHVGPSYGAGYYAMCARSFDPDFIFSWPSYHLAVMGGKNAAFVLQSISKKTVDEKAVIAQYEQESSALYNSQKGRDDCMILPEYTRIALRRVMEILK